MSMPLKWSSTIASGVDLLISNMMYLYYIMAIPVAMWLLCGESHGEVLGYVSVSLDT